MKRKLLLFPFLILVVGLWASCAHEKHHKDPHKKYRVLKEDSTLEDHIRDSQPH